MALCKEMGSGEMKSIKSMLVVGKIIRLMVMAFIKLKRVITKVYFS